MRAAVSILFIVLLTSLVLAEEQTEALLLHDGAYGTTVQGGIDVGESRIYYLIAKKGQQFRAHLVSLDDNGFLKFSDSKGKSLLPQLPKTARIRDLDLVLPRDGKYRLEIASREGQCSYLLEVTLDDPPKPAPPK